tara:strand:+ start:7475 stop:8215 length:741 start_codon:yes stop_codon:yes gene_type:complete
MKATIKHKGHTFQVDLSQPIDISIPLKNGTSNPTAWHVPALKMEPVVMGDWIGEVKQGGSVNFFNIAFNPHGHGTHTESVGHISIEKHSINQCVQQFFFTAEVKSVTPQQKGEDRIITLESIRKKWISTEAIVIRTLPNSKEKLCRQYSNSNPPYLQKEAAEFLKEQGVKHLLIDLPSVDKEVDGGVLEAHHAFWDHPENTRLDCSITELIFVPDEVKDGSYLLNLSFAPFDNDASPSRPTLYKIC